jgi:DNA mismatch endonuclease, patch repair protein
MILSTRAPSFRGLKPSSSHASVAKRRNTKVETTPEILLRKALWSCGLRYRKNVRALPGVPDIVFWGKKVVVFCDGDFWHGRNWPQLRRKLTKGSNSAYWTAKIRSNIERDRVTTKLLEQMGWTVIRVWETDVRSSLLEVVESIRAILTVREG